MEYQVSFGIGMGVQNKESLKKPCPGFREQTSLGEGLCESHYPVTIVPFQAVLLIYLYSGGKINNESTF